VKIVFDTNVYISEALFNALAEAIVRPAREGFFSVYVSDFILAEVRRVLLKDFKTTRRFASLTTKRIGRFSRLVPTSRRSFQTLLDPNDHPVLETAINASADFLVTGDKHLLVLSPFQGIVILRVGEFYRLLKASSLV